MSNRKLLNAAVIVLVLTIVVVSGFAVPERTHAANKVRGMNGQQVYIETGYGSPTRVVIKGTNQYGNYVTYDSSKNGSMTQKYIGGSFWYTSINNWWWKGTVNITVYNGKGSRSCSANVPKFQLFSNWTYVYCGKMPL